MSRISSLASNTLLINKILDTQTRVFDLQVQASSEKVSQDYKGVAVSSERLINLENSRNSLDKFITNNGLMDLRLEIAETTVEGIRSVISDFKSALTDFQAENNADKVLVGDIQNNAFKSLQSIEALLNTKADGRFIFSGARTSTQPADFGLTTISAYQTKFDGAGVRTSTTRDAHLENFSINKDGNGNANWLFFERVNGASNVSRVTAKTAQFANVSVGTTITISGTGSNDGTYEVAAVGGGGTTIDIRTRQLTTEAATPVTIQYRDPNDSSQTITLNTTMGFTQGTNTMTRTAGDAISAIPVGTKITIAGAAAGPPTNNGSFTVASNNGTDIVIESKRFTNEGSLGAEVAGTVAATSYYKGDEVSLTHRVDTDRSFEFDITGIDPAFEKAIRAMKLILQGKFGTEGGLDNNQGRVGDALYLLQSSLTRATVGTPPFGTEKTGSIEELELDNAFHRILIKDTNARHQDLIAFFDNSVGDIENVDPTEAITRLLDQQRTLEASFQAFARIRQLSLINFL